MPILVPYVIVCKGGCHGHIENQHSPNGVFHGNMFEYHYLGINEKAGTHEKNYTGVHGGPH